MKSKEQLVSLTPNPTFHPVILRSHSCKPKSKEKSSKETFSFPSFCSRGTAKRELCCALSLWHLACRGSGIYQPAHQLGVKMFVIKLKHKPDSQKCSWRWITNTFCALINTSAGVKYESNKDWCWNCNWSTSTPTKPFRLEYFRRLLRFPL